MANEYLSTLSLLQKADQDQPLDDLVLSTHLEMLKELSPEKQRKLVNGILPFVKHFDRNAIRNVSEVYSMWLDKVVFPSAFQRFVNSCLDNTDSIRKAAQDLTLGTYGAGTVIEKAFPVVIKSLMEREGEQLCRDFIMEISQTAMQRSIGFGIEHGSSETMKMILEAADIYGSQHRAWMISEFEKYWCLGVVSEDDYGESEPIASVQTLELLIQHGADPNVIFSHFITENPHKDRCEQIMHWLVDAGADVSKVDLTTGHERTVAILKEHPSYRREILSSIVGDKMPAKTAQKSPKI